MQILLDSLFFIYNEGKKLVYGASYGAIAYK